MREILITGRDDGNTPPGGGLALSGKYCHSEALRGVPHPATQRNGRNYPGCGWLVHAFARGLRLQTTQRPASPTPPREKRAAAFTRGKRSGKELLRCLNSIHPKNLALNTNQT